MVARSANFAGIVSQHERCLHVICKAWHLFLTEHVLQERKESERGVCVLITHPEL